MDHDSLFQVVNYSRDIHQFIFHDNLVLYLFLKKFDDIQHNHSSTNLPQGSKLFTEGSDTPSVQSSATYQPTGIGSYGHLSLWCGFPKLFFDAVFDFFFG